MVTKKFVEKVMKNTKISRKPKSMRRTAKVKDCSVASVSKALQQLNLYACKKIKCTKLTSEHRDKRKASAIWIRKNFGQVKCRDIMFSDEKWFDADGASNSQNDRVYAESREETDENEGLFEKTKWPTKGTDILEKWKNWHFW